MMKASLVALSALLAALSSSYDSVASIEASKDLASRLKIDVKEISTVLEKATTWNDGSWGMPKPCQMSTMALVDGYTIVLKAKNVKYLYTASKTAVKFGGPVDLWTNSLLYLAKHENEPNLNDDLMACSIMGTNPKLVLESISSFDVLLNSDILAVRRTSRSGFCLLLLKAGQTKPVLVDSGFAYGAVGCDGKRWAAYERQRLAAEWDIQYGNIVDKEPKIAPALPAGEPTKLVWSGQRLLAQTERGWYSYDTSATNAKWEKSDGPVTINEIGGTVTSAQGSILLNKSESLVVKTDGKDTIVATQWFTGDTKDVARIANLKLKAFYLVRGGYVVVSGIRNESLAVFVVDLSSHAVFESLAGEYRDVQLLGLPAAAPTELKQALK